MSFTLSSRLLYGLIISETQITLVQINNGQYQDKKVIGTSSISFPVKATNEATVEGLEVIVADKEGKIEKRQRLEAYLTKCALDRVRWETET